MKCLAMGLLLVTSVGVAGLDPVYAREGGGGALTPAIRGPVVRHTGAAKGFAVRVFGPPPPSNSGPAYEASANFNLVHANAGPSECGCFFMYGLNAQFAAAPRGRLAAVADFGRSTAHNISGQGHDVTLTTYLAGVRYPFKPYKHVASYAEILIGLGHSDTNFAIDSSSTNFAYAFGGGVNYPLGRHFDLKLIELDFLGTLIPNGVNDRQNQLRVISGIVYHFPRTTRALPTAQTTPPQVAVP